jgi:hypothetical protein
MPFSCSDCISSDDKGSAFFPFPLLLSVSILLLVLGLREKIHHHVLCWMSHLCLLGICLYCFWTLLLCLANIQYHLFCKQLENRWKKVNVKKLFLEFFLWKHINLLCYFFNKVDIYMNTPKGLDFYILSRTKLMINVMIKNAVESH